MYRCRFLPFALFVVCQTALQTSFAATVEQAASDQPSATDAVDYVRDIRPVLSDACYACHGPDAESRDAELRLDQHDSVFGESSSGEFAVVPGKPDESELLRRIASDDEDELMPPADSGKTLDSDQIALFRRWIEQGASWQDHWSFVPPERAKPPAVSERGWPRSAVDSFILARLDREQLKPSPPADKETILRRVTFDLTGLPPTLEEIDAFLADDSPVAYEHVVDRLLRTPHYGEHMARFWLDSARYGDTHGLHLDNYREIWPYRDWVVRAFNDNLPYDQFTVEQLAGDLLPNATLDQRVATGFCRCNVSTSEGGSIEEEVHVRNVVDRVTTTGTVFLGLTFECTRCHDHKFDPLTMHDFYSLYAFFNSIDGPALDGNVHDHQPSEKVPTPEQAEILAQSSREIEDLTARRKRHRDTMEPVFQQWWIEQRLRSAAGDNANELAPIEGLVGHYDLDLQDEKKVTNVVESESVGEFHGDVKAVAGRYGQAIELAEGGYVDLGDVFDLDHDQSFSFGVWVRVPKDSTGTIFAKTGDDQRGYALKVDKGQALVCFTNRKSSYGIEVATSEQVVTPDRWHHVMVTYAGSAKAAGVVMYVDGRRQPVNVKQDSLSAKATPRSFDAEDAPLLIGRLGAEQPLVGGQVDELRFYDRPLTSSEVVAVMLAGGVGRLVAQSAEETSDEQANELRDYFFHYVDAAYADMVDQQDQAYLKKTGVENNLAVSLIFRERKEPRDSFMLVRGEYDQKGDKVERATPAVLGPLSEDAPRNRLGLAQWLVDPNNPLTARVAVNRFWAQLFGTGLVKTAEDFGSQGEVPTHPELLDWLAVEFRESGWDVKSLMKTIVLSNTYRQSSRIPPELVESDSENRLLARGPRFRLDAEMLRDQALAVSGLLVKTLGGPGVKPPQPDGLWFAVGYSGSNTVRFVADSEPEKVHRRTLYTFVKRTSPPPQMSTFDGPSREACSVRRERTNTPLQALLMLNDPQYVEAARALAQRVMGEARGDSESRIRTMIRISTGHRARNSTVDELRTLYKDQLERFRQAPEAAESFVNVGQPRGDDGLDTNELAAWTMVANVVLNLDEVVNKN